jgi:hypothetical protein
MFAPNLLRNDEGEKMKCCLSRFGLIACCLVFTGSSQVNAFFDGPVATPDPGTILNGSAAPNRVKCWVARTGNRALAVSIYANGTAAKLRLYKKEIDGYLGLNIKIPIPGEQPQTEAFVVVVLEPYSNKPNTFEMKFLKQQNSTTTPISVGYITFLPSVNGRTSSDVVVRLRAAVKGENPEAYGPSTTNPCDEPPTDDIGEEEQMDFGATIEGPDPTSPGRFLSLFPSVATDEQSSPNTDD